METSNQNENIQGKEMLNENRGKFSFQFLPLLESDISFLIQWLKKPHVQEYWPDRLSDEQVRIKYRRHIKSGWVFPFLMKIDQRSVGYIQAVQTWKEGNGWWPNEVEGTYGLDLYIGEEEFLGLGLGPKLLIDFMENFSSKHLVKKWIIEVDPLNRRAWRCYEKAGFLNTEVRDTPEGQAQIMELNQEK